MLWTGSDVLDCDVNVDCDCQVGGEAWLVSGSDCCVEDTGVRSCNVKTVCTEYYDESPFVAVFGEVTGEGLV